MIIACGCIECSFESGKPNESISYLELNDDGYYEFICIKGHKNIGFNYFYKHELLFDYAIMAMNDGYPRESISSLAASIERFYEFCVRIIHNGVNSEKDNFDLYWKKMGPLSERQYGFFISCMISEKIDFDLVFIDDARPKGLKSEWKKFRNSVIHNGYIPTEKEVLAYGEMIFYFISKISEIIKGKYNDRIIGYQMDMATSSNKNRGVYGKKITTGSMPTMIGINI